MNFLDQFVADARARQLFPAAQPRVVVACSGGADSLFLLYLLWRVREALGLELSVLTCDHGLRPESAEEARGVQQRAWTLGLPCQLHQLEVPRQQLADESVEMAARRLRRKAYAQAAEAFHAGSVALGHHMDDQAETLLLRLARGTGPRGAGGMEERSPLNDRVTLVRPLLGYRRAEIAARLHRWGLRGVEDPGNAETDYRRNRVRHEVLPLMESRLNAGVVRHLAAFAAQQRKLEAWVSQEARERGKGCVTEACLQLEPWRFLPEVLQERLLMGWLRDRGVDLGRLGSAQMGEILRDLNRQVPHARCWEICGQVLRADQDALRLASAVTVSDSCEVTWPGQVWWAPLRRPLKIQTAARVDRRASGQRQFDQTLTAFMKKPPAGRPLRLRAPLPGDKYQPLGMQGRMKLSDLFINERLPANIRPLWPVVLCGNDIVWVPGFRVAEQWRAESRDCLKLELTPADGESGTG